MTDINKTLSEIKNLIANDKNASMFQSLGQYRKWLLGEIKKIEESLK